MHLCLVSKTLMKNINSNIEIYTTVKLIKMISSLYDFDHFVTLLFSFRYENNCYIPGSLTRAVYPAFYEGSEFVISGQLASNRRSNFVSRVASIAVTSPMELTSSGNSRRNILKRGDFPRFVERFWAYLNIKRLEDTILSTTDSTDHILAGARIIELAQRASSDTLFILIISDVSLVNCTSSCFSFIFEGFDCNFLF